MLIRRHEIEDQLSVRPDVDGAMVFDYGENAPFVILVKPHLFCSGPELRDLVALRLGDDALRVAVVFVQELPQSERDYPNQAHIMAESPYVYRYDSPTTRTEQLLVTIWNEVLGRQRTGALDDFLDLGGDSVHAIRLIGRIHDEFDVAIDLAEFFEAPSVRALAAIIDAAQETPQAAAIMLRQRRFMSSEESPQSHVPVAIVSGSASPAAVLDAYVTDGPCTDAQLVVWSGGEQIINHAVGEARPGVPMSTVTKARLDCAVKPVLALGALWLRQCGLLSMDTPVSTYIPEFSCGGKEKITTHHLLTHTSGLFAPIDIAPYRTSLAILQRRLFTGTIGAWQPGAMAAYDPWGGWYTLAAIIERITTTPWAEFLTEHILKPIGAHALELVPGNQPDSDRLELPYRSLLSNSRRGHATFPIHRFDRPEALAYPNPGYGGYASMETLTVIFRTLADQERCADLLGVDPAPMKTPQRPVLYDETLEIHCPMAYGMRLSLGSWNYSDQVSTSAFGHSSDAGTWALCDPAADLVIGLRMNGAPSYLTNEWSGYRARNGHPVIRAIYRMADRRRPNPSQAASLPL
jgi:CubicO group peptidase (beta-lactamase class C family)